MTSHKTKKQCAIENKTLLAQLPYYNGKVLTSAHPQFNSLIDDNRPSRKLLDSLSSLYDLSVFQLNSLDKHIDPDINLASNKIRSKYYSPHSFAQFIDSKQLQSKISFLHTNIRSLKKNFEEFQHHVLSEMSFRFTIIGVTETRICDRECSFNFVPELPGYCFESVPTPLSAGGVGLFIDQKCKYRVLERVSSSCYQALWIELHLPNNKFLAKPWLTAGLRKSIRVKNNLFYTSDRDKYKFYRNKIIYLTRLSKANYYQSFFDLNIP